MNVFFLSIISFLFVFIMSSYVCLKDIFLPLLAAAVAVIKNHVLFINKRL